MTTYSWSYYSHDKLTINYTSDYGRTWSPTYQKQWPPQEKINFHFRAFWVTTGNIEFYPSKCHLYFPTMFLFIFSALKHLQNNILSVASASNDNHTKISNSHWSFQETLGRGVQTKKPFVGGGGSVNCFYFSGTTQYIEEHLHVISGPHTIRDLMIREWRCLRKGHFKREFTSFQTFSRLSQVA